MDEFDCTCIGCPMGCAVKVLSKKNTIRKISGYECERGKKYAVQEMTNPLRTVTSLMRASNREKPFSVKTSTPIPKEVFLDCIKEIFDASPEAPLKAGDIVIRGVCGTEASIVVTEDID